MKTAAVAIVLLLWTGAATAQWSGGVQVSTLLDDNAFNNYLQINDRLTEVSLQGAYDWETETSNVQLFYTATVDYFALLPSRSFQVHSSGLVFSHIVDEDEETLVNAGGTFTLRDNRDDFTIYDHSQVSLYGNLRSYFSDVLRMSAGYTFRSVWFAEWSELDYMEHTVFIQSAISLPTRTTFILQADLGFKGYRTPNPDDSAATGPARRMGISASEVATPGVTQLSGSLRIGQGLAERTGLSLTANYQASLAKESRYLSFEDGILTDDEIFDDHYGYDGPLVSLMLTQILPADFRVRASGSLQERRYNDRPAFDLLGQPVAAQRIDARSVFSLSLDKSFPSLGLQASLAYDHIINSSNDEFYSYRNQAISLTLSFSH
jgi:hypothetical protein